MAKLSLTRRSFCEGFCNGSRRADLRSPRNRHALAEGVDESAGEIKRIRSCCRACGKVECGVWSPFKITKSSKLRAMKLRLTAADIAARSLNRLCWPCTIPDRLRYCMKRTNPKGERSGLGSYHAGRGLRRGRRQVQRNREEVAAKRTSPWAASRVGPASVRHAEGIFPRRTRTSHMRSAGARATSPAFDRRNRLAVDGSRAGSAGVCPVGHRRRILQLRLHEPYCRRLLAARLQAHPRRPRA